MVGTIIPMVHRESRKKRFATLHWIYTLGCIFGASCLGLCLGVLGRALFQSIPDVSNLRPAFWGCGVIGLAYSLREVGILEVPAPQLYCQVPEQWRHQMIEEKAALYYGMELGFGVLTRIPVSAFYVIIAWAFFAGDPLISCVSVAGYGLGKAMPVIYLAN